MEENLVVEEKTVENVSKEVALGNALFEVENMKKQAVAVMLYKKGIYELATTEEFDESAYKEITYKKGYKGYSLYEDQEGNVIFAKALKAENESASYAVEVVSFPKVTEEELEALKEYKKSPNVLFIVAFVFTCLFLTFSLAGGFAIFFNSVSSDFGSALAAASLYGFGFAAIACSVLALLAKKSCKK